MYVHAVTAHRYAWYPHYTMLSWAELNRAAARLRALFWKSPSNCLECTYNRMHAEKNVNSVIMRTIITYCWGAVWVYLGWFSHGTITQAATLHQPSRLESTRARDRSCHCTHCSSLHGILHFSRIIKIEIVRKCTFYVIRDEVRWEVMCVCAAHFRAQNFIMMMLLLVIVKFLA